jgi:hypothetical protein
MGRKKKVIESQEIVPIVSNEKISKQEETLDRMKQNRQIDAVNLRDVIIQKLKWAEEEKKKGETVKQELLQKMETLKHQIARIEGIIIFINDLLLPQENKVEKTKEEKK